MRTREKIIAIQNEKLVKQVRHVWDDVPYYRKKMERCRRDAGRHAVDRRSAQAALFIKGGSKASRIRTVFWDVR
jgi:hypothetical protein